MKLTPFGEAVRVLRMKYGISLKTMANAMEISSAYLSSIEFGDKRLAQKHIDSATQFLSDKASAEQLKELRIAAEQSKQIVDLGEFNADARRLVSAFARRLKTGLAPTPQVLDWLDSTMEDSK